MGYNYRKACLLGFSVIVGKLMFMSPRSMPTITEKPNKQAADTEEDKKKFGKLTSLPAKELLKQLTKKEKELQDRLDAAKTDYIHAEKDLVDSLKSLTAVQVSARKAI